MGSLLLSLLLPMQVSSPLRLRFTLPLVSTTLTRVDPPLETTLDCGNSFQSFFSSPGPSPFPLLDTLRELSFGRDTRPWRPLEQLSLLFRDTNTLLLDASLELVPGFLDSPLVTLLTNSLDSSTTTTARPRLRELTRPPVLL